MATKKPNPEQIFVLRKLAVDLRAKLPNGGKCTCLGKGLCDVCLPDGGKISYYQGGFWSTPGQEVRRKVIDLAPADWHTARPTVDAMVRRGWLKKLVSASNYDIKAFPDLADRQITAEGLALVETDREEPHRYDPDDGKIHVRTSPSTPTAEPVLCGRTGAASVSEAYGYWGPGGAGFHEICPTCFKIYTSKKTHSAA